MHAAMRHHQKPQDSGDAIRPGVSIVIGVSALLAIVLMLKVFRSSRPEESSTRAAPMASHPRGGLKFDDTQHARAEGGGWIAELGTDEAAGVNGTSNPPRAGEAPPAGAAPNPGPGTVDESAHPGAGSASSGPKGIRSGAAAGIQGGNGLSMLSKTGVGASGAPSVASANGEPISANSTFPFQPPAGAQNANSRAGSAKAAAVAPNPAPGAEAPSVQEQGAQPVNLVQPPGGLGLASQDANGDLPTDQRAHFDAKSMIGTGTGGVSFWLQPQWEANDSNSATLVQLGSGDTEANRLEIYKNGQSLNFTFAGSSGDTTDIGAAIDGWQPGEKHLVTATWGQPGPDGQSQASFYVDGKLVGQQSYTGKFEAGNDVPLNIGSDYGDGQTVPGVLSNFKIYKQALAPAQLGPTK